MRIPHFNPAHLRVLSHVLAIRPRHFNRGIARAPVAQSEAIALLSSLAAFSPNLCSRSRTARAIAVRYGLDAMAYLAMNDGSKSRRELLEKGPG
jgi:hypothetical protein